MPSGSHSGAWLAYLRPPTAIVPAGGTRLSRRDFTTFPVESFARPRRSTLGQSGTEATEIHVTKGLVGTKPRGQRLVRVQDIGARCGFEPHVSDLDLAAFRPVRHRHEKVLRGRTRPEPPMHANSNTASLQQHLVG